jgi:hypothetical protein
VTTHDHRNPEYWREVLADLLHKYGKVLDEIARKRKR